MISPPPFWVLWSWKVTGPLVQLLVVVNAAMGEGVTVTCSVALPWQPSLVVTVSMTM